MSTAGQRACERRTVADTLLEFGIAVEDGEVLAAAHRLAALEIASMLGVRAARRAIALERPTLLHAIRSSRTCLD